MNFIEYHNVKEKTITYVPITPSKQSELDEKVKKTVEKVFPKS